MILAALMLPALLVAQVRTGEQLHYRTTWTRRLNGPQFAGSAPMQTQVSYTTIVTGADPAHVSWTRRYTGNSNTVLRFSRDAAGNVVDPESGKNAGLPTFVYNSSLLGPPPAVLRTGASWSNTLHHKTAQESWTSTVMEANAITGTVRLHLRFQGHDEAGFTGDKYVRDQREDGEAIFVRGVMTKLSLHGYETMVYSDRRFVNSVAIETRLEDPGSP